MSKNKRKELLFPFNKDEVLYLKTLLVILDDLSPEAMSMLDKIEEVENRHNYRSMLDDD